VAGLVTALALWVAAGAPLAAALPGPRERALEAMRARRFADAIEAWRTHLALRPDDDEARTAYARALAFQGRRGQAMEELRAVLRRHPRDADVRALLARVLAWDGARLAALSEAERALEIDPWSWDARLVAADVHLWEGRPAEAIPHYARALLTQDDPEVRKRYVRALLGAGLHTSAEREARRLRRSRPDDAEAKELLRAAELASVRGFVEGAVTLFEAGRVHPWWRVQASGRVRVSSSWELGGGLEHHWRDFRARGTPPVVPEPDYSRDTFFWGEGIWRPADRPWSLYLYLGGAPQATFFPRITFEASPGYAIRKGLIVSLGYKGLGYVGQWAHLFTPSLTWYFGPYFLAVRYYLAVVHPLGDAAPIAGQGPFETSAGHAGLLRFGGEPFSWLGYYAGVAGGLAFVTAALGPVTSPAISAFAGMDLRPTAKDGIRVEYEYVDENVGGGPRLGVTWHGVRLAYYRRF
jgi:YaiO family outer membrane protein